ncbi:ferredoxin reductase family protein [Aquibaculum arenosum]|uniref:Ferredoxin reductase family protein n=1 Tax=Aquibaculum arenosum TaxID=3032591 RepID=A0ABT5YJI7_9PROT|nr:ferredoxin reductase family protein [Fodinicurvata sp. CAU 1616]MDF2095104.1 ferredoxin reductase family protein [Fodinicurvata sp. CAU 1616]
MAQDTTGGPIDGLGAGQFSGFWKRLRANPPGWRLTIGVLGVTTVLWVLGRMHTPSSHAFWPWFGPSMLLAILAVGLMAVVLLATVRSPMIEPLFGGLDRAIRLHRQLAPWAVGLIVVHVAMLVPMTIGEGGSLGDLLIPFWSPTAFTPDSLALIALLIWTGFAYARWWSYEGWLALHNFIGPIFLIGTAIAIRNPGTTVVHYEPLRFWIWLLILVGLGAWAYRVAYRWIAPRFNYRVEAVTLRNHDTVDCILRPQDRRMLHEPGTFVFINRPGPEGKRWELHPFSVSSSPTERDLRISARMVGDFTRALPAMAPGEPVEVFGPFGGFTPHRYARYRRLVCIGAGIGITPFMAMLRFEASNNDFRRIWLWYVARTEADAPYDDELQDAVETADSYVDYELWLTSEKGRLTAQQVMEAVAPLDDYAVMLCGTPQFVRAMTKQFVAAGLPRERVIAEDFYFR